MIGLLKSFTDMILLFAAAICEFLVHKRISDFKVESVSFTGMCQNKNTKYVVFKCYSNEYTTVCPNPLGPSSFSDDTAFIDYHRESAISYCMEVSSFVKPNFWRCKRAPHYLVSLLLTVKDIPTCAEVSVKSCRRVHFGKDETRFIDSDKQTALLALVNFFSILLKTLTQNRADFAICNFDRYH
eukprot:NODE_51_length_27121_cov_0.309452.p12 type:complete len:184 gc:universal NODE_51_length_27121_cov_0.309452:13949-14500(+)